MAVTTKLTKIRLSVSVVIVVLCICAQQVNSLSSKTADQSADADTRCQLTLNGLFDYYWKNDPKHKKIEFLFACGQLGQVGTAKPGQCSCISPNSCVNCYRWWTAVTVESVATYGISMNTSNHSSLPSMVYSHSPYNGKWDPHSVSTCTYIDDFLWYGIAYLRVYDWLQDEKWLNYSIGLYDWAYKYGWDDPCGGFSWNVCPDGNFKFNIEYLEAMHLAAKLAYTLPNETRFMNDSLKLWDWFFSYDNGYGLMSDEFLVSTGAIPLGCCNATSKNKPCFNSRSHDSIYSQGLLLSSAAYLYLSTGNKTYIDIGIRAFEAVVENYTKNGVLRDELRGFPTDTLSCNGYADPGGDWFSFNGIFMLHLGYFTELLVKNGSMPAATFKRINNFMQNTSDSAWSKSAVWPPFNQTNVCKPGTFPTNKNATYPKFHWWWGEDVLYDYYTTADPLSYFHKSQLRCYTIGNDTQIWEGQVKTEDKCRQKCDRNVNCSKYLWQLNEYDVPGTNCWIWSYNRSNHICNLSNYNWNVGVKRPKGQASCAGKCGSSEPQKLEHGVCYCDTNCSKHLDCCLDYANQCRAKQPATCKGHCNDVEAQPVPGGGYCWCSAGCNLGFVGGSCCGDYQHVCLGLTIQPCLDGRTQGSAFNLFLGHSIVSKLSKK